MLQTILLGSNPATTVTVVGQHVTCMGFFIDLKRSDNATLIALTQQLDHVKDGLSQKFFDFIGGTAPKSKKCFEHEADYSKALCSTNPYIRALVALNGKMLDETVKDEAEIVRLKTIDQFITKKMFWADYEYDLSILDPLVHDESVNVLLRLGVLSEERHLDILVNNDNRLVRAQCGSFAPTDKYDDKLSIDEDETVRATVALKGACALLLASDESVRVRINVARGASVEDINKTKLDEDDNANVRWHLANRGIALEQLVNDSDDGVKLIAEERLAEQLVREEEARQAALLMEKNQA